MKNLGPVHIQSQWAPLPASYVYSHTYKQQSTTKHMHL